MIRPIETIAMPGAAEIRAIGLPEVPRSQRRGHEVAAVATLVEDMFGSGAKLLHEADGAPYIEGYAGYISITHTPDMAVLAVSADHPVGIDAERWRDSLPVVGRRFMNGDELAVYGASPRLMLRAWTAKEAVFKALHRPQLLITDIVLPSDPEAQKMSFDGIEIRLNSQMITDTTILTLAEVCGGSR